ncbi:hypothetical protein BA763_02290 [Burkholderia cenocepacia]|nr:hypothetical protein BA763_02290 [Burkholderia cenocepacia]
MQRSLNTTTCPGDGRRVALARARLSISHAIFAARQTTCGARYVVSRHSQQREMPIHIRGCLLATDIVQRLRQLAQIPGVYKFQIVRSHMRQLARLFIDVVIAQFAQPLLDLCTKSHEIKCRHRRRVHYP